MNHFWRRLAILLLWENPFSNDSFHFIDTYFLSFNDDDKVKLKKFENFDLNLHNKPLFNYPSFLKTLDFFKFELLVNKRFKSTQQSLYSSVKAPNFS